VSAKLGERLPELQSDDIEAFVERWAPVAIAE
jgi:hypothetical protein